MKNKKMTIYYVLFFIVLLVFIIFLLSSFFSGNKNKPQSIKFSNSELAIYLDDTLNLKVNVLPEGNYKLVYSSDNPNTVKVDENGKATGLKMGTATIKVSVYGYDDIYDTCRIIVLDSRVPVTSVTLDKNHETIFVDSEIILNPKVLPEDATNKKVKWTSSNSMVASVHNGVVKGLSMGTTTITATSNNGHEASCEIKVVNEKKIVVNFVVQDKNALSGDNLKKECIINKTNPKCEIQAPDVTINDEYELIGWSTNKDSKTNDGNIIVNNDTTYYSITKKKSPITASLIVQNETVSVDENKVSCYLYNGIDSCNVTLPLSKGVNGNSFIGWSTDKNATSVNYKDNKIVIKNNTNLYSITKKDVTITYDPGENSENNIKADKLLFTSNEHTKCTSYNGNGCNIYWIPTIYSKGHVVHGFSKTPDGKCISVVRTKFTEDTTLYARVYDSHDKKKVPGYKVSYEELYGNIIFEVEYGITSTSTQKFINFIKTLFKDHPELFYFNGKVVLLTEDTYIKYNGNDSAGITWTDDDGYFSVIYVRYNNRELSGNRYLGTTVHEIGHGYNNLYNQILGKHVSSQPDVIELYKKYKNMSSNSRPLSDYAYNGPSRTEFFSEALLEVYRANTIYDGKEYYMSEKKSVPVTSDIKNMIKKYLNNGKEYFKKIGRIS